MFHVQSDQIRMQNAYLGNYSSLRLAEKNVMIKVTTRKAWKLFSGCQEGR